MIEKQISLENDLKTLEDIRDKLRVKIIKKRKELKEFMKQNGNQIFKQQRKEERIRQLVKNAESRKDPEWIAWHKKFIELRK